MFYKWLPAMCTDAHHHQNPERAMCYTALRQPEPLLICHTCCDVSAQCTPTYRVDAVSSLMRKLQVFVSDKKRAKLLGGVEPYNRIKKDLLKQVLTVLSIVFSHSWVHVRRML